MLLRIKNYFINHEQYVDAATAPIPETDGSRPSDDEYTIILRGPLIEVRTHLQLVMPDTYADVPLDVDSEQVIPTKGKITQWVDDITLARLITASKVLTASDEEDYVWTAPAAPVAASGTPPEATTATPMPGQKTQSRSPLVLPTGAEAAAQTTQPPVAAAAAPTGRLRDMKIAPFQFQN